MAEELRFDHVVDAQDGLKVNPDLAPRGDLMSEGKGATYRVSWSTVQRS
ncbi:MAG: hypothetical protein U0228_34760 [Myxococcaceae bacterium]